MNLQNLRKCPYPHCVQGGVTRPDGTQEECPICDGEVLLTSSDIDAAYARMNCPTLPVVRRLSVARDVPAAVLTFPVDDDRARWHPDAA